MPSTSPSSLLYSKVNDEFTLPLPVADAIGLCRDAARSAKSMNVLESEENRLLVKYSPVMGGKNAKIEVLCSDAGGAQTTVTLRGWFFGMGKRQLRKTVKKLHVAIDEQAKQNSSAPGDPVLAS